MLALVACTGTVNTDGGQAGSACELAVARAAAIPDSDDSVEDLDEAIRVCGSLSELESWTDTHPSALDGVDARAFVGNRCRLSAEQAASAVCMEIGA